MRQRLYTIIIEAETPAGKWFDIFLMVAILCSVSVVMLDSIASLNSAFGPIFYQLEWLFTLIFTFEYGLRLWVEKRPAKYARSFFGLIDLFSVLPTYISLLLPGTQYLLVIRLLRVLRVFRVLKLVQFMKESRVLIKSLKESMRKILVFIFSILILVTILGSIIYSIEGAKNGFTSIPKSIYWAIVTLTTVGYGDIAPQTNSGQFISAIIMLLGYGLIAVPAGIVTSELTHVNKKKGTIEACPSCTKEDHDPNAIFCNTCGEKLN